jgi:hypothetical protein
VLTDDRRTAEAYFDIRAGDEPADGGELVYKLTFSCERLPLPNFRVCDLSEKYANENTQTVD